jgi:hypothetical protein
VIHFRWQSKKERPKGRKIVRVERGAPKGVYVARDFLEAFGVSGGENDLGAPSARARRAASSPIPEVPPMTTTV